MAIRIHQPRGSLLAGWIAHLRDWPASISTVNWSEVVQKAIDHGISTDSLREDLEALGLAIVFR